MPISFPLGHNIENSCKSRTREATMITQMPTILTILFALFLPSAVNNIEPAVDARTIKPTDELRLRNVGKYDKKSFNLSGCEADGLEEKMPIHNAQIDIGTSKRMSPAIDRELLWGDSVLFAVIITVRVCSEIRLSKQPCRITFCCLL